MSHDLLREPQVRQLWHLIGETRELEGGRAAQKHHVANGLCRIIGANVCALVLDTDFSARGKGRVVDVVDVGWATEGDRERVWSLLQQQGTSYDPALGAVMKKLVAPADGTVWAELREDLVPDRDWYRSLIVSEAWRAARVDDSIYAGRQTSTKGQVYGMGLKRAWGDRRFSEEDRNLIRLFLAGNAWLWESDPFDVARGLCRRERQTLRCLLEGDAVKQIAARLHISAHTAQQYVKGVYRALRVHSRGELLALFVRGEVLSQLEPPELH